MITRYAPHAFFRISIQIKTLNHDSLARRVVPPPMLRYMGDSFQGPPTRS